MTEALADSWYMAVRQMRNLWRQPWWIAITLVQPVIWLLLYGALFKNIIEIPGFRATSYADFLTPGIVVMSALFSSGWSGMGVLEDIDRGVLDRFLVSPVRRGPLIAGRLIQNTMVVAIQSVMIVALGLVIGASYGGGVKGVIVLIAASSLLGGAIGALSYGLALVARKEETLISVINFVVLPLTFLSTIFMQASLVPGWIQSVAKVNPVNWAVVAGREALTPATVGSGTDWGVVGSRLVYLLAFALACAWVAARAFRAYQRSV